MAYAKIGVDQWQVYLLKRKDGITISAAARESGISRATAMRMEGQGDHSTAEYRRAKAIHDELNPKAVVAHEGLCDEARQALGDFAFFRVRYFGRYSTPWQVHAAEQMAALLETEDKEYVVINVPPGAGKSTLFTHDILVWLICRNRAVRIMIGSATDSLAKQYGGRILRTLERPGKLQNDSTQIALGRVADAEGSLIEDFGAFKPAKRDRWRQEQFVVEQSGIVDMDQKEATVTTYGRDGGFLGGRFDLVIWDDLVSKKVLRTAESREQLQSDWDGEFESRLEPGGVMILQGQRLHANDLYRYVLDKREPVLDDNGDLSDEISETPTYKHIIYKAHHDEVCKGFHGKGVPPYDPRNPEGGGCLLDPWRLSWRELQRKRSNNAERFLVLYQQEDTDPTDVLVNPLWISGGRDPESGESFPGVWDEDRRTGIIPPDLTKPWLLAITADPSPANYWSVQSWIYHHPTRQKILVDHYRGKMTGPQFLGMDPKSGAYSGLLEEWRLNYLQQGHRLRFVIVEDNAAQRFLLQQQHVVAWAAMHSIQITPHQTHGNKNNPEYGVYSMAPDWKFGRVRLPGNKFDGSRGRAMALVNEVKQWPESNTEDCVMAAWFFSYRLQKHLLADLTRPATPPKRAVPSWLSRR